MTKSPTFSLLLVQPDAECPVERFGPWLEEAGARLHVVRPYAGDQVPDTVDADGLVVLGGDMGAHDDAGHPWLADVRTLMNSSVDRDVPTLGICLGGQILATARGGTVARGTAGMESGVIEVTARTEALADELMRDLPWPILQGSMHRDAITDLPPTAIWLAELWGVSPPGLSRRQQRLGRAVSSGTVTGGLLAVDGVRPARTTEYRRADTRWGRPVRGARPPGVRGGSCLGSALQRSRLEAHCVREALCPAAT